MIQVDTRNSLKQLTSDLLCLFCYEGSKHPDKSGLLDKTLEKKVVNAIKSYQFQAKQGDVLTIEGNAKIKRISIFGMGKRVAFDSDQVRLLFHQVNKHGNGLRINDLTAVVPGPDKYVKEAGEGLWLGDYRFKGLYQKESKERRNTLKKASLVSVNQNADRIVKELEQIFMAVNLGKDLVNLPSNIVTPTYLENEARKMAQGHDKIELEIIDEADAKKKKMGSFLAVARGSREPAKMIVLNYKGNPRSKKVFGVIGKGITFDSGGISIKPSTGMSKMKMDMAGSAAALGTMKAVAGLDLKVNLIVIVAAAENMPGGDAYRPGDIVTASNGKTIEIINTDAEGRLVLADALVYAQKLGANRLIDIATLTGACIVTFGNVYTGLMGNNPEWTATYLKNSHITGERTWELPVGKEYDDLIKSDVCDMVNANENRKAGTIMGGKFLEQFIDKKNPWIHLDIASTAFIDSTMGYLDKNATGTPIRTIVQLLKSEGKSK